MEFFGKNENLIKCNGIEDSTENALANKIIGLYFSAKWCPPCREFTPKLAEIHQELVFKRKTEFEIVFISFDKSEEEMFAYMKELHGNWWALKYDSLLKELSIKFINRLHL